MINLVDFFPEAKDNSGFVHRGGGYYSRSKDGEITHKSDDNGKIRPLEPKEKDKINKTKDTKTDEPKTKGQSVFGKGSGANVFEPNADTGITDKIKSAFNKIKDKIKGSDVRRATDTEYNLAQDFAKSKGGKIGSIGVSDRWDRVYIEIDYPNGATSQHKLKIKKKKDKDDMKLKSLMPNLKISGKPLSHVEPIETQKVSTIIDKLADMGNEARAKGEKAPNFNLCKVSIPGTNLYCQDNKGIPREQMPQFKGAPEPGSTADKLPKDRNGEVDTEAFFKQMLQKRGISVSRPVKVPADRLKSTQSELVGVKVAGMSKVLDDPNHPAYKAITAPIYVSQDGYVLDGHHRWAAIVSHNAANPKNPIPMNVRVIGQNIKPLVALSNKFAERIGIKAKAADTGKAGGNS